MTEGQMHRECAIFALQACVHLARGKGRYSERAYPEGAAIVEGAQASEHKAEWFALMHGETYTWGRQPNGMIVIRASEWLDTERWRDGAPIK